MVTEWLLVEWLLTHWFQESLIQSSQFIPHSVVLMIARKILLTAFSKLLESYWRRKLYLQQEIVKFKFAEYFEYQSGIMVIALEIENRQVNQSLLSLVYQNLSYI